MSLSYDLARAESDVAHINLDKEYDELITDIEAVYNLHRYTFKNALGENSGEIVEPDKDLSYDKFIAAIQSRLTVHMA